MSSGVYLRTEYHNEINSLGSYKKWQKPGYRERMVEAHKGQVAWNKEIPCSDETKNKISKSKTGIPKICLDCSKVLSSKKSKRCRKCDSISQKNRDFSYVIGNKYRLGLTTSEKQKRIMRERCGKKHPRWKGGVGILQNRLRKRIEYKQWRRSVFIRDEFTCRDCGMTHIYIYAHHIKSFAHYPEFRYEIDNGKTLCEKCHSKTHNYKGRNKNVQMGKR